MFDILKTAIGTGGPLLVEHKGRIISEQCILITHEHVNKMIDKLKNINFIKIEQTSDRSFFDL